MPPISAARPRPWALAGLLLLVASGAAATLLLAAPAPAVPARPGEITLTQPNGDEFRARLFGDEWYNGHETRAGYTILQGEQGQWRYARQTDTGELRPSQLVVGRDRPALRKHLRDRVRVARADRLRGRAHSPRVRVAQGVAGPSASPSLGQDESLVILAQFDDQTNLGSTPAQWSAAYFGGTRSVSHYYSVNSGGQFGLSPAAETHGTANDGVVGWVNVPMDHPDTTVLGASNRLATKAAIQAANPYVDYTAFDTNGDGVVRNTELHITVIAAGQEASCCSDHGDRYVWGHRWQLMGTEIPTVDGKAVGGWGYTQFGEMHGDHMATLGIMVHEIGHDLDLPDLYDTDQSSHGVGNWSVMGGGSWGSAPGDDHQGMTPPLMDAWSRSFKGWITPEVVTGTQVRSVNAATSGTTGVAIQMLANPGGPHDWTWQGGAAGEYFLVENRQRTGYDASLPGSGLVVWHVDESQGNNDTDAARLVDIEEADGAMVRGDTGDTFKSGGATTFGASTKPNSKLNNGSPSGVSMNGVGANGATMSATFTATDPTDLGVALTLVDRPGETGFTYRVTLDRVGAPDLADVLLNVELPPSVELQSYPDDACTGDPLVCPVGPAILGDETVLDFDVMPLSPGPHRALADLSIIDTVLGNNSDSAKAGVAFVCDNTPTAGNDKVTGTAGDDILCGLGGNDTVAGTGGDDLLFGGAGRDTLSFASAAAAMVVDLNRQDLSSATAWEAAVGPGDGADLATEFERTRGTAYADTLFGNATAGDQLWGLGGADLLYGREGNDQLYGGDARDRLYGHRGQDLLVGGGGVDRLDGGTKRDTCQDAADKRISCEA